MEYAIRDTAAIVTMLNGIVLIVRARNASSLVLFMLLAVLVWLMLFRGAPHVATSIGMIIVFGYVFVTSVGVISTRTRSTWNQNVVRFFFGKRGEERWMAALNRTHDREVRAKEKGVSVVEILKQDTANERENRT